MSPPLDAAAVADPDSHSLLIPGPLDALAGFQASFSDALRGELHRLAAMRAGERRCRFRHAARIARLWRSTDRSEEPSCGSPTLGAFSRELSALLLGRAMGRRAIFLLRAGLAVVGVGRHPRPATSPDDMRTQDVPTPALDRDTRADTEHLSVRVVDVRLQPAVRVTEDQDVTGDHQPLASLGGAVALRSERRRVVAGDRWYARSSGSATARPTGERSRRSAPPGSNDQARAARGGAARSSA